jgi:HTH-type transcriptional regulator, sugar sensing transcriptional regulator
MYEQELQNLGLSEKEAKVYLASLEVGAETAQNLAKEAGINRATTYVQIESLKTKGLMSEFEKGKKTYYVAESPQRLTNLFSVFEKELDLRKSEIKKVLPALQGMFEGMGERPKVRFFEGEEGVAAIREDFLKTKDKLIEGFINLDQLFQFKVGDPEAYSARRVEKKIASRLLYARKDGPSKDINDPKKLRTAKYLGQLKFPLLADITLYENKIAIMTYRAKPIGIIIESKEITDTLRSIFYALWDHIK